MIGKIVDKEEVAKDTLAVTFEPEQPLNFQAGQHVFISLIDPPYSDSKGPTRHFSIVNSPNQNKIIKITTRLRDSAFKKSLRELPLGTKIEIGEIAGKFILPESQERPFVFIAGGIGITPFMSMLTKASEDHPDFKITLLYSNRDQTSTAYFPDLQKLAADHPNIQIIFTMTEDPNWKGENRRIEANFIKEVIEEPLNKLYFIAGPPEMVEAIYQELKKLGIEDSNIKTDNFSGY